MCLGIEIVYWLFIIIVISGYLWIEVMFNFLWNLFLFVLLLLIVIIVKVFLFWYFKVCVILVVIGICELIIMWIGNVFVLVNVELILEFC